MIKHKILKPIKATSEIVVFECPTEVNVKSKKLCCADNTLEWIWSDTESITIHHTLYTAKTHIAYTDEHEEKIMLHKIMS